jgi:hypothetical protein
MTWSIVPLGGKLNALHSTAIFRLPTPRKPPKSMTAAHVTVAFDDHVDNLAHVLVGVAANALPQNALHLAIVDDGCRGSVLSDGGSL